MEEQRAGAGSPPVPVNASRRQYSPEHKAAVLKALVSWTGSRRAFCELLQGIYRATLSAFLGEASKPWLRKRLSYGP